jgi:hypothetical protein
VRFVERAWCAALVSLVSCSASDGPADTLEVGDNGPVDRASQRDAGADDTTRDSGPGYATATAPRTPVRAVWLDAEVPPRPSVSDADQFDADQLYVVLSWQNADYEEEAAFAPWADLESYRFGVGFGRGSGGPYGSALTIDPVMGDLVYTILDPDFGGMRLRRFRTDGGPQSEFDNDPDTQLAACPATEYITSGEAGAPRGELWLVPESGLVIMECIGDDYDDFDYYTETGAEIGSPAVYGELRSVGRNGLTLWQEHGGELFLVDADGHAIQPIEPVFAGIWALQAIEDGFMIAQAEDWGSQEGDGKYNAQMSITTLRNDGSVERQIFPAATTDVLPLLHCAFLGDRALVCVELRDHIYRETDEVTYYVNLIASGELEIQRQPLPERGDGTFAFDAFVAKDSL